MLRHLSGLLLLAALTGCSKDSAPNAQPSGVPNQEKSDRPAVNEREAGKAWEQFISQAKTRRKSVQDLWARKYEKGELEIAFLRDDVKLDSARGVMVGEVQLKADEFTVVSYKNKLPGGDFGKGSGKLCEYTLRFRYNSGSWQHADGSRKATDIHDRSNVLTSAVESLNESRYFHLKELFQP